MAIYMSSSNFKPCIDVYREGETLLLFSSGATCRRVLAVTNPSLRFRAAELNIRKRRDLRFPTAAHNIRIRGGGGGGINFFKWKQKQNRQRDLQSILMRSLVFFASKQNFIIDFLVNNWSEYAKVVLEADSDGGQGGGFTFLPGLGGRGDENYRGRKSSEKWWLWFLFTTAVLGLVLFIGIYSGILKIDYSSAKRFKELARQAGSYGLLLLIVVSVACTGSIFVGFLRSLIKNSKVTVFPPRRTHKANNLTARSLLWVAGIGILYPVFTRAEGMFYYLGQLQQTMDRRIRTVLMVLCAHLMRYRSLCQNRVEELKNSVANREAKPRNRRKGRAY